jgi:hypothetical protein
MGELGRADSTCTMLRRSFALDAHLAGMTLGGFPPPKLPAKGKYPR